MKYLKAVGQIFLIAVALLIGVFGAAFWPMAANIHFLSKIWLWVTIPWILSWYGAAYIWYIGNKKKLDQKEKDKNEETASQEVKLD